METPQPRPHYGFDVLKRNEVKKFPVKDKDEGSRVLGAAYAFGRRNDRKFCGAHELFRGKLYMLIRRLK